MYTSCKYQIRFPMLKQFIHVSIVRLLFDGGNYLRAATTQYTLSNLHT